MSAPSDAHPSEPAQILLLDSFGRIDELVWSLTGKVDPRRLTFRPDPQANTIAWLLWHLTRVQDDHVSEMAGVEQMWTAEGWYERFDLPFTADATGYGQSPEEVGAVDVPAELLAGYHHDVHEMTINYIHERVDAAELDRVVDDGWDPPVTAAVRLVSVIGDCSQHLGQAAYVLGMAERAGL